MSILRHSKYFFNDLVESNSKPDTSWKRAPELEKIEEVTEISSKAFSIYNPTQSEEESPFETTETEDPLKEDKRFLFFLNFLSTLSKHPKVYKNFTKSCFKPETQILMSLTPTNRLNRYSLRQNLLNQSLKIRQSSNTSITSSDASSLTQGSIIQKSKSQRKAAFSHLSQKHAKRKYELSQISSGVSTISNKQFNQFHHFRGSKKLPALKPESKVLQGIFKKISEEKTKATWEDFFKFLILRYPSQVAETISKHFTFTSWTYEEYVAEMNKFVNSSEERHLAFSFEIFDFNKDKLINYKDTFTALEIRNENIYDSDIVSIEEIFNLKREGRLKTQKGSRALRRRSTFSLIKDAVKEEVIEPVKEKLEIQDVAINYKEFCMVKFHGRPQIIQDIMIYCCDYYFCREKGLDPIIPVHSQKNSERMVMDMIFNADLGEAMRKNDKYDYYCSLESAMKLYVAEEYNDLFKKFNYLMSNDKLKYRVISKQSMMQKLPDMTGYKNDYLSGRFYEYLSQGKDLTKAAFLFRVHTLIKNPLTITINKFAFDLIDSREDNRLSVDEIYRMYEALPVSSKAFEECNVMVEMYIQSIFEKVRGKLVFIDFKRYSEIVGVSCLGVEFVEILKTPFEKIFHRKGKAFEPTNLTKDQNDKYEKTKSSLLSMIS